jgi:hypothetical protein
MKLFEVANSKGQQVSNFMDYLETAPVPKKDRLSLEDLGTKLFADGWTFLSGDIRVASEFTKGNLTDGKLRVVLPAHHWANKMIVRMFYFKDADPNSILEMPMTANANVKLSKLDTFDQAIEDMIDEASKR